MVFHRDRWVPRMRLHIYRKALLISPVVCCSELYQVWWQYGRKSGCRKTGLASHLLEIRPVTRPIVCITVPISSTDILGTVSDFTLLISQDEVQRLLF